MRGYNEEALNAVLKGIPAGRFGEAKDIVGLTQFLASSASSVQLHHRCDNSIGWWNASLMVSQPSPVPG
jgi:phage tail sheath protein FI